ncbi:MAG: hypothetical protein J0L99_10680 [Chitinophagales bacterium]|nr:hypothetical protein [Chitinophagales bacterium]
MQKADFFLIGGDESNIQARKKGVSALLWFLNLTSPAWASMEESLIFAIASLNS